MVTFNFTGEFDHRLDERGRLAIPTVFRPFFEDGGYLVLGPENQLDLLTDSVFKQRVSLLTQQSSFSAGARRLRRQMLGNARKVELDRQHRILIPQSMRESRNLEGQTIIVGVGDYLEVWSSEAWQREQTEIDETFADLLEELAVNDNHAKHADPHNKPEASG